MQFQNESLKFNFLSLFSQSSEDNLPIAVKSTSEEFNQLKIIEQKGRNSVASFNKLFA